MQNMDEETCVVAYAKVSEETCAKLNYPTIMKMLKPDGASGEVKLKPSKRVKKFDMNSFLEVLTED